jgi:hypothetical protein
MATRCFRPFLLLVLKWGNGGEPVSTRYLCQALFPLEEEPRLLALTLEWIAKLGSLVVKLVCLCLHALFVPVTITNRGTGIGIARVVAVLFRAVDSHGNSKIHTERTNR